PCVALGVQGQDATAGGREAGDAVEVLGSAGGENLVLGHPHVAAFIDGAGTKSLPAVSWIAQGGSWDGEERRRGGGTGVASMLRAGLWNHLTAERFFLYVGRRSADFWRRFRRPPEQTCSPAAIRISLSVEGAGSPPVGGRRESGARPAIG